MNFKKIFWLHVRKSAGTSVKKMLYPHYIQADDVHQPACFIQSNKEIWNAILNNYQVPLGKYQLKRMLFAKKFLFSDKEFSETFKFAFARNPYERSISQFFYLWLAKKHYNFFKIFKFVKKKPLNWQFSKFLDTVEACFLSESNHAPKSLHFQTHIAKMSDDIEGENGEILLNKIWRLEDIHQAIDFVKKKLLGDNKSFVLHHLNESNSLDFHLNKDNKARIQKIYHKDFEIYENSKI